MSSTALIMSSAYSLELDSISVCVGLCPFDKNGEYPIKIEISYISFDTINKIMMNIEDFFKVQSVVDALVLNIKSPDSSVLQQKMENIPIHHHSESQTDFEIKNYIVSVFHKYDVIRFSNSKPILDISFKSWYHIKTHLKTLIHFKTLFLQKYRMYARVVHDRLVRYYFEKLKSTYDYNFTQSFIKTHIINIETSVLPPSDIKCDYKILDYDVCFLIDSEIRFKAALAIYSQVCTCYVNYVNSV